ncbi:MAG: aldehyde dehydrogenase family protein [Gammaproteobacteria bacterium]|nr:MAG: aldehyde dehydrogenase family protein [Gammaproteobacteria bacterium]
MAENYALMIPGANPSGELKVTSPFDGSTIGSVRVADIDDVEKALKTAYALYQDRDNWLDGSKRIEVLEKTAALMQERFEYLAIEAAREGGKPLMDSRVEVTRAIDGVKNCAQLLRFEVGREIPMGINAASNNHLAFTRREPIGVVVAVSAFNHPLNLIVHQVGPAIAAGCPVIVKPAGDTPLSCMRFVSILREAGLPEAWCQACVVSGRDVAEKLVTDSRVGFFSFIGSADVGWMLRSKLAPGTRCALEHGGSAPVILADDANLHRDLPMIAKAGFYHAGQVCVSVQRVFAPRSIADDVAHQLAEYGEKMKVGDPTLEDTEIGPLIRPREVERVHNWVQEAIKDGAWLVSGGEPVSDTCYPATVLLDPPETTTISCKEVFGPVICVYSYTHIEEAIQQANSLPYAFQAAVYTQDIDTALKAYKHLDASAVMVNDHTAFRVDWMPFAGLKVSGHGTGGISYTFEDMTIEKMMVIKSAKI